MDGINDYLQRKASQLGLERGDTLSEVQCYLDKVFPGKCRAVSINDGVLRVTTKSASIASELRFMQVEIKGKFNKVKHLVININY